jgi:hypothetical protein
MKKGNALISIGAMVLGLYTLIAAPNVQAGQRPIEDFLKTQGTYIPSGFEDWPAWTFFYGWTSPDLPYALAIDYAGVASRWLEEKHGISVGTTFNGFVNERALPNGTTEVTVILQARNALAWVSATQGDPRLTELVFGYRPDDIVEGKPPVLGDCTLQVKFISTKPPGSELPDLESPEVQLITLDFVGQAHGPLRSAFGVPDGTPGFIQTRQTGLIRTSGKANPKSRVALDAFPAEKIIIKAVGR